MLAWRRRPFASETLGAMRALRDALRKFAPAFAIDAQGLWKSAIAARASGAPVIGFSRAARREPLSAVVCEFPVTPAA